MLDLNVLIKIINLDSYWSDYIFIIMFIYYEIFSIRLVCFLLCCSILLKWGIRLYCLIPVFVSLLQKFLQGQMIFEFFFFSNFKDIKVLHLLSIKYTCSLILRWLTFYGFHKRTFLCWLNYFLWFHLCLSFILIAVTLAQYSYMQLETKLYLLMYKSICYANEVLIIILIQLK